MLEGNELSWFQLNTHFLIDVCLLPSYLSVSPL